MSKKRVTDKATVETPDLLSERTRKLQELVPEAFSEGHLDWEKLRSALGDAVESRPERYSFTWAGKRDAIRMLQAPSRATLVPCPEESVNFDSTENVFIEGENLEVLKLLYKAYYGRVKMIYIDPPYNTGNDFIYPDNFADPLDTYLKLTGQRDSEGNLLTSNPEKSGRYHSAWLSMMYPRLFLARQLLREDGVIFVSIDDHEVANLRLIMNEIFGEENRVESFVWKKSYGGGAKEKYAVTQHEYVLMYARGLDAVAELWLPPDPETERRYYKFRDDKFETRGPYRIKPLEASKSMDRRENLVFAIPLPAGGEIWPKRQWWWKRERALAALANDELVFTEGAGEVGVSYKQYLRDEAGEIRGAKPFSVIDGIFTQQGTQDLAELFDQQVLVQFPKPVALMKKLVAMATTQDAGDLVVDFFAGSCSAAHGVLALNREDGGNRRFIMAQLPEPTPEGSTARKASYATIADIGKERIRRVIQRMSSGQQELPHRDTPEDLGFKVFKLASSRFRQWTPPVGVGGEPVSPERYAEQLELFTDPLLPGWKPPDVIHEVALKEGLGLNVRIERVAAVEKATIFRVTDPDKAQSLLICLDEKVSLEPLRRLGLTRDDLFICRDVTLDDETAANLALQCRLKTI